MGKPVVAIVGRPPAIRLKIVDFPTFGLPTMATTGLPIVPFLSIQPLTFSQKIVQPVIKNHLRYEKNVLFIAKMIFNNRLNNFL